MRGLAIALALAFVSVGAASASADTAPANPPFALPATFSGMTACADCPGIRVTLSLVANGTYTLKREYMDKNATASEQGTWSYDSTASQLRLVPEGKNSSPELFAISTLASLQMLGADGKPIPSGPSNVLSQVVSAASLEGVQWNLAAIGTQPYTWEPNGRGAGLYFNAAERRISGSTGCNRIMGSYERSGSNGLHIAAPLGMTRVACDTATTQTEGALLQALAAVASFQINGDTLVLLDRSGAEVARFTAMRG